MSRHLKLIAALAVVLVAISGFSPARKGGGRSSHSKGGGCSSSSSSSHNSSSSYHHDDDSDSDYGNSYRRGTRYNNTTGSTGSRHRSGSGSASGTIEECAAESGKRARAVVNVSKSGGRTKTYQVRVNFRDASGTLVDTGSASVTISSSGSDTVDVPMEHPSRIGDVAKCEVESVS